MNWIYDMTQEPGERQEVLVAAWSLETGDSCLFLAMLDWRGTDEQKTLVWVSTYDGEPISRQRFTIYAWSAIGAPREGSDVLAMDPPR